MPDFMWRQKTRLLIGVMLVGGHQVAKPITPGLATMIDAMREFDRTKDFLALKSAVDSAPPPSGFALHEPADIGYWHLVAMMYLAVDGTLMWLLHATTTRKSFKVTGGDIALLEKIITMMEGDPVRHQLIGPRSAPAGESFVPFGWWTWPNKMSLLEMQINSSKSIKDKDVSRIVPRDTRESDGYTKIVFTKGFEPWGDRPPRHNGSNDPCDMWTGPCACGATHTEGK